MTKPHHFLIDYRVPGPHDGNGTGILVAIQQSELRIGTIQHSGKRLFRFFTPELSVLRGINVGKTDVQLSEAPYICDQTVSVYYAYHAPIKLIPGKFPVIVGGSYPTNLSSPEALSAGGKHDRARCRYIVHRYWLHHRKLQQS